MDDRNYNPSGPRQPLHPMQETHQISPAVYQALENLRKEEPTPSLPRKDLAQIRSQMVSMSDEELFTFLDQIKRTTHFIQNQRHPYPPVPALQQQHKPPDVHSQHSSYTAASSFDPRTAAAFSNGPSMSSYTTISDTLLQPHTAHKRRRSNSFVSSQHDTTQAMFSPSTVASLGQSFVEPQDPKTPTNAANLVPNLSRSQSSMGHSQAGQAASKERFVCPFCEERKEYQGERTLRNHLKGKHEARLKETRIPCNDAITAAKPSVFACGLCIWDEPFLSEEELYHHIAMQHSLATKDNGDCDWDFSKVMVNHLMHPKLREHFRQWPQTQYEGLLAELTVELLWKRDHATVSVLKQLQAFDYEACSDEEAASLVHLACMLNFKSRLIVDLVTPTPANIATETSFANGAMETPDDLPTDILNEDLHDHAADADFDAPRLFGEVTDDPNAILMGDTFNPSFDFTRHIGGS